MFFTKMAIRFLASAAFVLFYMGSSYGQCPNFTLKLEQPNPNVAVYDVMLETPTGGIQNIVTVNVALNFGVGATNLGFSNVHPQLNSTNMSVNELMRTISFFQINTNLSFSGPEEHLFSVSYNGPVGECVSVSLATNSQFWIGSGINPLTCIANISNSPKTFCFGALEVAGTIESDAGSGCSGNINNGIPGVQISITPVNGGGQANCGGVQTANDGQYSCDLIEPNHDYEIVPSKENNPGCGLTTLDLGKLQAHLEGNTSLTTNQQLIAADYNVSGLISTLDRILLHRKLLGFPNSDPGKSWRFFRSFDYGFLPNPPIWANNIPGLPAEFYEYSNLSSDITVADFVGVKIGDINGSCTACSAPLVETTRPPQVSNQVIEFFVPDVSLQKGQKYLLPIKLRGGEFTMSMLGFGLKFDNEYLQLLEIIPGDCPSFSFDNFNLDALAQGELRHIWLSKDGDGARFTDNSTLFYLKVEAKKSAMSVSKLVYLDEQMVEPIATFFMEKSYPLKFSVSEGVKINVFPNPFADEVSFRIPTKGEKSVQISIYDGTGRLLKSHLEANVQGLLQWTWMPEIEIPGGIYYYTVEIGKRSLQGKILKY